MEDSQKVGSGDRENLDLLEVKWKAIRKLPNKEGWPFGTGMLVLSINSSIAALIGNSFHRRMMRMTSGLFLSALPLTVVPFVTTAITWHALINVPIMQGDIHCPLCVQFRGATLNLVIGAVYPMLLSAPLVASFAIRDGTMKSPHTKGLIGIWRWYSGIAKHMKIRFVTVAFYQFALGGYVASKAFLAYKKSESYIEVTDAELQYNE